MIANNANPILIYSAIFSAPILLGGIIALINNDWSNRMIARFSEWIDRNYLKNSSTDIGGWFSLLLAIFFWLIWKPICWTRTVKHLGLKSGIRVFSLLYSIYLILCIIYIVVVVTIAILICYVAYKLIVALLDKSSENVEVNNINDNNNSHGSRKVKSWLWGDHTEYYEDGMVIRTSIEKEGFFGDKYTEHYNSNGTKFATTSKDKTWAGTEYDRLQYEDGSEERHFKQYGEIEYRNKDGEKYAVDKDCETFFGDKYTEHCDKDGNVEKISREKEEGLFYHTKYIEHSDGNDIVKGTSRVKTETGFFKDKKYIEHRDSDGNVISEIPIKE